MKKLWKGLFALVLCVMCLAPILSLAATPQSWYCPDCEMYVFGNYCYNCSLPFTYNPEGGYDDSYNDNGYTGSEPHYYEEWEIYDMGVPQLESTRLGKDSHNLYVYWVQVQMKATGLYYQGEEWDETGVLGDHTRAEISRMMEDWGYEGHDGSVDKYVILVICNILDGNFQPVYVNGFYNKMYTLTSGSRYGSMRYVRNYNGSYSVGTEWVQRCLSKLGYYKHVIDGEFGEETIKAVKAFQRDHNFQQRPYVSMGVARRMLEECVARNIPIDDLP